MIKSFRFANCQLGNSLVLGPGALETGHMPRLPWWEDIVFIAAFLVTQHKIINYNIFLEVLKPTSSNFGVELIRIWSSKFMKCSQALKSAVYINCKNKK